ncbi:MAG: hypothetical protein LBK53_09045 [Heliobacteriaceae bacterium]|jgi:type II secretory pathway component GspD/PulD (secretin)|nr:hypothetical protein [Heliobacteriaceae bacterium]
MKNNITKKITTFSILTAFLFTGASVPATQDTYSQPALREAIQDESMPLKGEISITKKNTPITLSLRESDVTQVLRMFADKAGLNIILHPEVKDQTVTLDLVSVPLNKAFELIMEISRLTYVLDGNTIIIAPTSVKDFNVAKQELTSIPVKYVDATTIAGFLNKNIYGINKPGISGGEVAVTNPATNELLIFGTQNEVAIARKVVAKFDKKPTTAAFKVNHTTPAQMADMVCKLLLPNALGIEGSSTGGAAGIMTGAASSSFGSGSSGFGSGSSSSSGSSGGGDISLNEGTIACSYESKTEAGALSSIALRSLSVSYYTQLGTVNVIGGSEQQVEMIKEFIAKTDKKQPQAYLEVSIIELSEAGSKTLDNTWEMYTRFFSASFNNGKTGNILPAKEGDPGYPIFFAGSKNPNMPNLAKYSGSPVVQYTINYLIENRKGRVVANPRILITNGQESTIDLTSDYVKSVRSEVLAGSLAGAVQRTYEIADDNGIKVSITPFISPDGYVTLNIAPEYATIKDRVTTKDTSGDIIPQATLLQRRNLDLKNVRIKDGETLIIGGMIREDETKNVKKVPILGDIPGLGTFFRSTLTEKSKEEMIIMITPKIITDSEDSIVNTETL